MPQARLRPVWRRSHLHGEYNKALDINYETRVFLKEVLGGFWKSGSFPGGKKKPARPASAMEPIFARWRQKQL